MRSYPLGHLCVWGHYAGGMARLIQEWPSGRWVPDLPKDPIRQFGQFLRDHRDWLEDVYTEEDQFLDWVDKMIRAQEAEDDPSN